jgi:hypothetical protein
VDTTAASQELESETVGKLRKGSTGGGTAPHSPIPATTRESSGRNSRPHLSLSFLWCLIVFLWHWSFLWIVTDA